MKLKYIIFGFTALIFVSCGSIRKARNAKKVAKQKTILIESKPKNIFSVKQIDQIENLSKLNNYLNNNTIAYIRKFASIAVIEMYNYKIPASITLAQGILESNSGKSELTLKSNNHFGIKCHKNWKGERVYYDDDKKGECFRKYKYPETSYKDHSIFLSSRKRYAFLFNLKITDYKGWSRGLQKAGYATDKKYPKKLITIIQKYNLFKFDRIELKKEKSKRTPQTNFHEVNQGETLYFLAKRYNTTVKMLMKLNNLKNINIRVGQHLLYK